MVDSKIITDFIELLNTNAFNYVLIKNDGNKIPYKIESGKDVDFLIHPDDYDRLVETVVKNGYDKRIGESCKRYFLYQLREDIFLKKEDCYFHLYDALPCSPITNMGECKMPLDNAVQEYIWKNKVWDQKNKWWIMDETAILLYLIVRSVFDKRHFKDVYINEIQKRIDYIDSENFYRLAHTVFFAFTDRLIELIKAEDYEHVICSYLSFREY